MGFGRHPLKGDTRSEQGKPGLCQSGTRAVDFLSRGESLEMPREGFAGRGSLGTTVPQTQQLSFCFLCQKFPSGRIKGNSSQQLGEPGLGRAVTLRFRAGTLLKPCPPRSMQVMGLSARNTPTGRGMGDCSPTLLPKVPTPPTG